MSKEKDLFEEITAENFNWDAPEEQQTVVKNTAEIVAEALEDEGVTEEDKLKLSEQQAEAKLMDEVFGDAPGTDDDDTASDEDEDDDTTTQDEDTTTPLATSQVATLNFLKEKGLVEFELPEGEELTEEKAAEMIEEGWEASLENEVEAAIKDLPDAVKGLVKIAVKGGDANAYLQAMAKQAVSGINKDTDMTVEANQELAVTLDLQDQDYDAEYIETHIQGLKDSGKLAAMAEKVSARIIKKQEDELANQAKAVEDAKKNRKEGIKRQRTELTEHLATVENIKGVVLNKKDKETLPEYISTPSVELQDGRMITPMQAELFKVMADKNKLVLLAKLLSSDFDLSSVSNATITAYSKGIKENVENSKQGKGKDTIKSSGSSQKPKKFLADMLD